MSIHEYEPMSPARTQREQTSEQDRAISANDERKSVGIELCGHCRGERDRVVRDCSRIADPRGRVALRAVGRRHNSACIDGAESLAKTELAEARRHSPRPRLLSRSRRGKSKVARRLDQPDRARHFSTPSDQR
jgi:hypothetical protein